MDVGILKQTARTAGTFTMVERPARDATTLLSKDFLAVALFSAMGVAIALCVAFASPCTAVDVNVGCLPAIEPAVLAGQ